MSPKHFRLNKATISRIHCNGVHELERLLSVASASQEEQEEKKADNDLDSPKGEDGATACMVTNL